VDDQVLRNAELAVKFGEQYVVKLTKKLMHEFNEDLLWGATNDDVEVELESDSNCLVSGQMAGGSTHTSRAAENQATR